MGKTAARETHIAIFQLHVDFRLVEDGIENVGGADGHVGVILVVTVQQSGLARRNDDVVRAHVAVLEDEVMVLFAGGMAARERHGAIGERRGGLGAECAAKQEKEKQTHRFPGGEFYSSAEAAHFSHRFARQLARKPGRRRTAAASSAAARAYPQPRSAKRRRAPRREAGCKPASGTWRCAIRRRETVPPWQWLRRRAWRAGRGSRSAAR